MMEARRGQTHETQESISAQDDKHLDRSRCPSLCKISIAIGILAVLIALLVGIIRGGGDSVCGDMIHPISVELVKNNTLLQAKVNEISMGLEKQSKQVGQLKMALEKQSKQIDQLTLQLNNATDHVSSVATELQNQTTRLSSLQPILSCEDIKRLHPNNQTGYYYVNYKTMYCNMDQLCGLGGGWTRVAYLDMSDATQSCPTGFRQYTIGGKRSCGRPESDGGSCTPAAKFLTNGISYSQICGRVEGYSKATPDALSNDNPQRNNIDSSYVDGVSVTRGSPRQHVWTFAASSATSIYANGQNNCPCTIGSIQQVPSFIGNNYYCEGGSADPLWDGQGCIADEQATCCSSPYLPWFYRKFDTATTDYIELRVNLNTATTDYIELRVSGDQNTNDDVPVTEFI
uniref:Fibrinogen C-terminal domain-containing protein n=1 Tax=Amphimedon queenslandica TaxID=400682 RepID=A0A1X7UZ34_AMPQE